MPTYRDPTTGDLFPSYEFYLEQKAKAEAGQASTFGVGTKQSVASTVKEKYQDIKASMPQEPTLVAPEKQVEISRIRSEAETIGKQIQSLTKQVEAKRAGAELSADSLKDIAPVDPTAVTGAVKTTNIDKLLSDSASLTKFYEAEMQRIEKEREESLKAFETSAGITAPEGANYFDRVKALLETKPEADAQAQIEEAQKEYQVPEWLEKVQQQSIKVATLQGEVDKLDVLHTGEVERIYDQPISMSSIKGQVQESTRKHNIKKAYLSAEIGAQAMLMQAYTGNLQQAQNMVAQVVEAYSYDLQSEVARFDELFDVYSDYLADLDQDEQQILNLARQDLQNELQLQKIEKTEILNKMIEYPNAGIALDDDLDEAVEKIVTWQQSQPVTAPTTTSEAGGVVVQAEDGQTFDLSTPAGLKQANDAGYSYEYLKGYLDTESTLSMSSIESLLQGAGVKSPEQRSREWTDESIREYIRERFSKNDTRAKIERFISESKTMTATDKERANLILSELTPDLETQEPEPAKRWWEFWK